jgi:GntR family transcriptional regulator, transcriptional repressor for pyruvate dehydrogenase complex
MAVNSLSEQVTGYIFNYIHDNQLQLGDKLPSELRTSAELKISRGIVREAFSSLSAAGIIESGNGRPPRVGELNSALLANLMHHALSTRQVSLEQVLDLRASIEVRAAELAAANRTDSDLKLLRSAVEGMRKFASVNDKFVLYDMRFHEVINAACGNILVQIIGSAIRESMAESIRRGLDSRQGRPTIHRNKVLMVVKTHSEIVDAIEARQSKLSGRVMKRHFDEAKTSLGFS